MRSVVVSILPSLGAFKGGTLYSLAAADKSGYQCLGSGHAAGYPKPSSADSVKWQ